MGQKYDIFLSYRRITGAQYARTLQLILEKSGFRVFLDHDGINDGEFSPKIEEAIQNAPVFIIILSKGSMDRCINANDWVRKEIELAVSLNKQIIPVNPDSTFDGTPEDMNFPDIVRHTIKSIQHSEISFGQAFNATVDLMVNNRIKPHVRKSLKSFWPLIVIIMLVGASIAGWQWNKYWDYQEKSQPLEENVLNEEQFSDSIKSQDSFKKFVSNGQNFVKAYFTNCMNETINNQEEIDVFFKKFRTPYIRDYIIRFIYIGLTKNANSEILSHDQLSIIESNTFEICDNLPIGIRDQSYPILSNKDEFESFLNKVIETVPYNDKVIESKYILLLKDNLSGFNEKIKEDIKNYYIIDKIEPSNSEINKIITKIIEN